MEKIYTVSFFGHRYVDRFGEIEDRLETQLGNILEENKTVVFLVGRNGDFDRLVSSMIRKIQRRYSGNNCFHVLVLPYMTSEFRDNEESFAEYYDAIEMCPGSGKAHFKRAMQIRNRFMIDRSDAVICYIERKSGGAYRAVRYAEEKRIKIINLG